MAPTRPQGFRYWMQGTVLALGIASIAMLIVTNWIREQLMIQDVALVHAVGEIRSREAISHLWIEEYVSGDEQHLEDAWTAQDRAAYLIDAILEGGNVADGRYALEPVTDPGLREKALGIRRQIEEFRRIARARQHGHERGNAVGIGSIIDQEYDGVFKAMLEDLSALEVAVDDLLESAHSRSSLLFRIILIAWGAIVCLAVTGLWTRERRRLVAEAALRQSEAQRLQSQKMEAVGHLAGGLAHDINNYLAAITLQCELAKLKPGDRVKQAERLTSVIDTAARAADLIRRLLAFSRRESVQHKVVSVNGIIENLKPMLDRLIGEDVRLRVDLAADLWNIKIDPSEIEQTIVNLVINSREAMPRSGEVVIRTANHEADGKSTNARSQLPKGAFVMIAVQDTGVGVPPELREQIFEPFMTTKNKATSSGLGLATVYGIAKQNHGAIRLDSEVGRGTTLTMFLPRTTEELQETAKRQAPIKTRGTQKILLVEDNIELRESTTEALEVLGYSIVAVENGEAAVAAYDSSICAVVSDVVMPGMNGREVMERLRKRDPQLPFIFVSGYTDDVMLRHGIKESEVDFLPKPFRVEELTHKIREVLGREAPESAPVPPQAPTGSTILIVEDQVLQRRSMELLLRADGFEVLLASNGQEAIDEFRSHANDIGCVLLDVGLPGISGEEAFTELRRIRPRVPVFIWSALDEQSVSDRLTMDHITGFLPKLFDAGRLASILRTVLRTGMITANGASGPAGSGRI